MYHQSETIQRIQVLLTKSALKKSLFPQRLNDWDFTQASPTWGKGNTHKKPILALYMGREGGPKSSPY